MWPKVCSSRGTVTGTNSKTLSLNNNFLFFSARLLQDVYDVIASESDGQPRPSDDRRRRENLHEQDDRLRHPVQRDEGQQREHAGLQCVLLWPGECPLPSGVRGPHWGVGEKGGAGKHQGYLHWFCILRVISLVLLSCNKCLEIRSNRPSMVVMTPCCVVDGISKLNNDGIWIVVELVFNSWRFKSCGVWIVNWICQEKLSETVEKLYIKFLGRGVKTFIIDFTQLFSRF